MTTELEACKRWVSEFDAIPQALVVRAFRDSPEDLNLLAGGERRSDCCGSEIVDRAPKAWADLRRDRNDRRECAYCEGEIGKDAMPTALEDEDGNALGSFVYCSDTCAVADEDENCGGEGWCTDCDERAEGHWDGSDDWPAMWGTHWSPSSWDEPWFRDNAEEVAKLGFLVYDSDETGILLGIDGAGYDFYEAHWLPLYRLRGLRWHDGADAADAVSEKEEAHT